MAAFGGRLCSLDLNINVVCFICIYLTDIDAGCVPTDQHPCPESVLYSCFLASHLCNGIEQCDGGEDEADCTPQTNTSTHAGQADS